MRLKVFICLALAFITFGLYWPARHFTFVYFDDPFFILSPQVSAGLSWYGLAWAIQGVVAENWHPITTFSFLLMHQLFGLNPGAEHLLNGAIHAANAALLFLVLREMTGATWRSAIVAAIFAWHPLRVESVAWIAERKDVLFMFFMLLSLLCYTRYTRAGPGKPLPPPDQRTIFDIPPRTIFYNLSLFFFILSFLSKATVVTLPFLLLLLDVWPLKRFDALAAPKPGEGGSTLQRLLTEKIPFFGLSLSFCAVTFWIHKATADVQSMGHFTLVSRLQNVVLSYAEYLAKFIWPTNLAILYPYPQSFNVVHVILAGALLAGISAITILQIKRRPYLAMGWFWYLVTMLPVIGLVQIGLQAMADRHTYMSLVGPTVGIVWLVSDCAQTNWLRRWAAVSATAVMLAACLVLTERQLQYWRDTVRLFTHSLAVTPDSSGAEFPLALALEHAGNFNQAAVHFRIAAALPPESMHYTANFYFGECLARLGQYREAAARLETALQLKPDSADAMNNLAWLLSTCPDEKVRDGNRAVQLAERACELTHDESAKNLTTLSAAYAEAGRFDDAIATVQKAGALAEQTGQSGLFNGDAQLLQLFTNHQAYIDRKNNE